MSIRDILRWPDPRLQHACAPMGRVTDRVRALAQDMFDTMYAAPGRGLAGPQVGVMQRIFVMDPTWKDGDPSPVVCIDPEILVASEDRVAMEEACLSIPGITAEIERPARIRLGWTDLDGVRREADLEGFAARCAQHECDHLNGIVTFDRLEPGIRDSLLAQYGSD